MPVSEGEGKQRFRRHWSADPAQTAALGEGGVVFEPRYYIRMFSGPARSGVFHPAVRLVSGAGWSSGRGGASAASAAAIGVAVSASGLVRARTIPLLTVEETDQALSKTMDCMPPRGVTQWREREFRDWEHRYNWNRKDSLAMMIELPEKLEAALRDQARARGVSPDGYVVEVLERDLAAGPWMHRDSASEDRDNGDAERRWLAEHQDEFRGRWVALRGSRLLASGPSALGVYRSARGLGQGVPYVAYVEEGEALPFAGW